MHFLGRRVVCVGLLAAGLLPRLAFAQTDDAKAIAKDAYIYGFPLVDSYRIQYSYFVDKTGPEYKGAWNEIHNTVRVYTPEDKAIQTPNSDTPYSFLGADLRAEPLVISVPEIETKRYYSLQFIDMYTYDFAYVGSRATGNGAGSYLLAGPDWHGETPAGIKAVIHCETQFAFVLYRTQLFGPGDIDNIKKIQAAYKVQTLSQFLGQPAPPAPPAIDFVKPLSAAAERKSVSFFQELNFILQFCPAPASEQAMLARFAKIGVGRRMIVQDGTPVQHAALAGGIEDAWKEFEEYKATEIDTGKKSSADCFGTREFLNGGYIDRMAGAVLGIYGNAKEEALYPIYFVDSTRQKLSGAHDYTLHFAADALPPVNAFWSFTLYTLPSSLLYANPLKRYLINSPMLPDLKRDADGGLTLYVQHKNPGAGKAANWLPAPEGAFFCAMRLYWPKPEALDGSWKAPPMVKTA